ncbi:hypothetical protein GALMADRAFT_214843 [Galerina marginata CBS 339.88]|uniref:Uncharacterized protein n=1 Tax=Galerina marginata (strain CBS 339.88) TaxID=685588 RepID=A0A067SSH0_GALM3|nr:hypothetical protein GALMADRAFT_214843 [Galerina marginata CBS 339.88]
MASIKCAEWNGRGHGRRSGPALTCSPQSIQKPEGKDSGNRNKNPTKAAELEYRNKAVQKVDSTPVAPKELKKDVKRFINMLRFARPYLLANPSGKATGLGKANRDGGYEGFKSRFEPYCACTLTRSMRDDRKRRRSRVAASVDWGLWFGCLASA